MSTPATPDPYGVDIAFSASGDLVVSPTGDLAASAGPLNVAQAVSLRLRTAQGDLPLHIDYGSTIPLQFIGKKQNPQAVAARLQGELTNAVQTDQRIVAAAVTSYQSPATTGLGPTSSQFNVMVTAVGGVQVTLADIASPRITDLTAGVVVDPSSDPLYALDTLSEAQFFADEPEYDQLADLDATASLVNDLPSTPGN